MSDTSSIKIWTTTKTTSGIETVFIMHSLIYIVLLLDIWSEEVDNTILHNTTTSKNAIGIMTRGSTGESKNYSHNISTGKLSRILYDISRFY